MPERGTNQRSPTFLAGGFNHYARSPAYTECVKDYNVRDWFARKETPQLKGGGGGEGGLRSHYKSKYTAEYMEACHILCYTCTKQNVTFTD